MVRLLMFWCVTRVKISISNEKQSGIDMFADGNVRMTS